MGGKADEAARAKEHNIPLDSIKTVEQGAATTIWAATSPQLNETTGGYYLENCQISEVSESTDINDPGVLSYAINPETAQALWILTERLLDKKFSV